MPLLQVDELDDGVSMLTLNDPDRLNPLSQALVSELYGAHRHRTVDDQRALILTGARRGFCSGADLAEAAKPASQGRNPASVVYTAQE
jgi:enoyl-CoA hydratase/carnithine racemase